MTILPTIYTLPTTDQNSEGAPPHTPPSPADTPWA